MLRMTDSLANRQWHEIDALNEQAWQICDSDLPRSRALAEKAQALSPSYALGLAASLRTLGYLNMRLGNHPLGLTQLLEALELCETNRLTATLPDVLDGIAGSYFQIGDLPTALDYMHRQLAAAEQIGDAQLIANAYNNLAGLYLQTGDAPRAIATLEQNLEIAVRNGFTRMTAISLINLAELHRQTGSFDRALEEIRRGMEVSQAAGFAIFEAHAHGIAGKLFMQQGEVSRALAAMQTALALAEGVGSLVTATQILLDLGQMHCDLHDRAAARTVFEQCVQVAAASDIKSDLSIAHRQLAELCEEEGDAAGALAHWKQHQAIKEFVAGEKAEQRLQVLQVTHDTAAARKEAELARQHTSEVRALNEQLEQQVLRRTAELTDTVALLQAEIAAREAAEAEIRQLVATLQQRVAERTDELATFFDLTLLAGQADSLNAVFDQMLVRVMEVTHSRALCIHLLDAEGAALHLAGQQGLNAGDRQALRSVPLAANFARWMKQVHDPLMTTSLPELALLPAPLRLADHRTYLGAQIKAGSRTVGLLNCYRFTDRGYSIDEIALVTALAGQLGIMLESQRLRHEAEALAVVQERQRLARDLHDSVTQSLYSLSLFSRASREAVEDGDTPRLARSLGEIERNTLHALREMRLLLYELRPADLEHEGLVRALQLRLDTVERRVGLQLDVQLDELPPLPPRMEVELYQIITEALNNVVKHAAASRLALHLKNDGSYLHLKVLDDGMGFDPEQGGGGLGLRNMRERAAQLEGQITIWSAPGRGALVEAVIPQPPGQEHSRPASGLGRLAGGEAWTL